MNATERQELLEDIALEISILTALEPKHETGGSIDLRGPNVTIGMVATSSLSGQAVANFVEKIMLPVLFGSAWKVLDLLVERAWQANGGGARPPIGDKVKRALATFRGELAPILGGDTEIAERLATI